MNAAELWGVGRVRVGSGWLPYPVSLDDLARDRASAEVALGGLGLGRGARVLVVSTLSEQALIWPFQAALRDAGAVQSNAEATRFDAFRTAMFLDRLRYDAVLGVNGEVLDGLADLGRDPAETFRSVRIVAARDDAMRRLCAAGVPARAWIHAGPAVAVGCGRGEGAHVDGGEWEVTSRDGEIVIRGRRRRAATIDGQPTGVRAAVAYERCPCGRSDPRIVPED